MSMVICKQCEALVDSDYHPETCPKCQGELFPKARKEPPADFMEQLERMSGNEEPS